MPSDIDEKAARHVPAEKKMDTTLKRKGKRKLKNSSATKRSSKLPSTEDLRRLLETLPQELYDTVYDVTFTAPQDIITVTSHTRMDFMNLTQVDSASRAKYIKSLCTNTVFIGQRSTVCTWLFSLDWYKQLQDVRVFAHQGEPRGRWISRGPTHAYKSMPNQPENFQVYFCETQMLESLGEKE